MCLKRGTPKAITQSGVDLSKQSSADYRHLLSAYMYYIIKKRTKSSLFLYVVQLRAQQMAIICSTLSPPQEQINFILLPLHNKKRTNSFLFYYEVQVRASQMATMLSVNALGTPYMRIITNVGLNDYVKWAIRGLSHCRFSRNEL